MVLFSEISTVQAENIGIFDNEGYSNGIIYIENIQILSMKYIDISNNKQLNILLIDNA